MRLVKRCGKTVITINASETDNYKSASKKITIIVKPAKVEIKSLTSKKQKINFKIEKQSGVSGYIAEASLKSNFNKKISVSLKSTKTKGTFPKVEKGKKYHIRIRAYVKINGEKYYSKWAKDSVKVK